MRNYLCAVACLCALVGVRAENLLLNGALEADQVDVPTFWRVSNVDGATPVVACRSSGGPSGGPSVRFYNPPGSKMQNAELRQYDMTLLPGGELKELTEVLVGTETADILRRYHFTIGFWGTNGVDAKTGFTTPEFNEAAVKRIGIENTLRRYVLCDSSKFSKVSLITFARFGSATIITDCLPEHMQAYRGEGSIIEVGERDASE